MTRISRRKQLKEAEKNKPCILHVSSAGTWRGGERQLAFLVGELETRGIEQAVLCAAGSAVSEWCREHGISYFPYSKRSSFDPTVAFRIRRLCRRYGYNIIHTHDSHAHTYTYLSAVLFQNPVPVVVHRRVDFPVGGNAFSRWKYNHRKVARIICVSEFIRNMVAGSIKDPKVLEVVYSGIDTCSEKPVIPPDIFTGIPEGTFLIGNIAALAPHKDHYTFVRTGAALTARGLPAKYFIVGGDGGEMAGIKDLIRRLGMEDRVLLTGFREDAGELMSFFNLFLFTSKTEGLGTSILDAFVCGVPVVATCAGGIPELVEDGVTGLLAPVGDEEVLSEKVLYMLEQPAERERMVANAWEKSKEFTKQRMSERILELYFRVLEEG